jgi:hypothetical protein
MELNDQLYSAAARGDVAALRGLVAAGADVNHRRYGRPCLSTAAFNGHAAAVEFLLASGADVDASPGDHDHRGRPRPPRRRWTALHEAAVDGPPNVGDHDHFGWTALHEAAADGHVEVMGVLLAAGADVHIMAAHGTPLYSLINPYASRVRGAKLLLLHGARVNDVAGPSSPARPLYKAIECGQRDLVKTFLRAGAEIPARLPALPLTSRPKKVAPILDLMAAIRSAGGWPEYVAKHRRVLSSFVSKLSAKSVVPLDAASHLVAFWCPPGGY